MNNLWSWSFSSNDHTAVCKSIYFIIPELLQGGSVNENVFNVLPFLLTCWLHCSASFLLCKKCCFVCLVCRSQTMQTLTTSKICKKYKH